MIRALAVALSKKSICEDVYDNYVTKLNDELTSARNTMMSSCFEKLAHFARDDISAYNKNKLKKKCDVPDASTSRATLQVEGVFVIAASLVLCVTHWWLLHWITPARRPPSTCNVWRGVNEG